MNVKVKGTSKAHFKKYVMDRHRRDIENMKSNRSEQATIAFRRKPFYQIREK